MSSFLYRLGQAAARHRWRTLGIWIAAVVAIFVIGGALGGQFSDDFNLPNSESQRAYDMLAERYPAASGTSAYVVFHAPNGPLEDQADAVNGALEVITGQPHVVAVSNPFETRAPCPPTARSVTHRSPTTSRPWTSASSRSRRSRRRSRTSVIPTWRRRSAASTPRSGRSPARARPTDRPGGRDDILLIAFGSVVAMGRRSARP